MAWNSHILAVIVFVDSVLGCTVKQFNNGSSTEHFEFSTTFNISNKLIAYQVVYKGKDTYGETKIVVRVYNNSIIGNVSHTADTTITGNITNGNFSFILNDVAMNKTGVYELRGKDNAILSCKGLYILGKPSPPNLSVSSAPEEGGETTFNCSSSSTTMPTDHGLHFRYTWVIGNQTNPPGGHKFIYHDNTLRITDIQRNQQGQPVICKVTENVTGGFTSDESSQQSIYVKYGPDTVTLFPPDESLTVNETGYLQSISCYAECYPDCTYIWTKKYQNDAVTTGRTLPLGEGIKREDAGVYTCTATNPERNRDQSLSKDVSIQVNYGPDEVILQPQNRSYAVNKEESLNDILCSADCYPGCNIKWLKDGNFHQQHSVLSIIGLEKKEAGNYTCVATNTQKQETAEKTVTVNVRYGPESIYFEPAVDSPLVIIEDDFQNPITCSSECYPGCTAAWNTTKATGAALSLGYVKRSDTGTYSCKSSNYATEYQKEMNKGLKIIVHYPPDINIVIAESNHSTTLKCSAKGEPQNYTFQHWIQIAPDNATEVQQYAGISDGSENTLVLNNPTYRDSGIYQCTVSNNIKTPTVDIKELHVKDIPYVIDGSREFDAKTHDNISMAVLVYSFPTDSLNVTWLKGINKTNYLIGNDIHKFTESVEREMVAVPFYSKNVSQQGYRCKLEINDIEEDEITDYYVHIGNYEGSVEVKLSIKPRGPPEEPVNFGIIPNSETTSAISFAWYPGFHGGANQTFHIEYRLNMDENERKGVDWKAGTHVFGGTVRKRQFRATVNELASGTSYWFMLYASNRFGNSTNKHFLVGNTTIKEEVSRENQSLIGLGVGAGVGAAVILLVIVGVVLIRRRRMQGQTKDDVKRLNDSSSRKTEKTETNFEVNLNPMYESAGEVPSASNNNIYAKVKKQFKKDESTSSADKNLYADVKKPQKQEDPKSYTSNLYSSPLKKIKDPLMAKDGKTKKGKKVKPGKMDKKKDWMVYENAATLNDQSNVAENVYENPSCSTSDEKPMPGPSRTKNEEGLIYVEVEIPTAKDNADRKPVIHGLEDRNDYAEIAFGKVGEPAPESDDENDKKE